MRTRGKNHPNRLIVAALLLLLFGATSTYAQAGPVLLKVGKWVGGQLISYVTGKAIDQALGIDFEKELRQVEATLTSQIKQERVDKEKLRVELAATRSTLEILNKLIRSKPRPIEVDEFRHRLAKDLEAVVAVQEQHGQRIGELERQVTELNIRLRQLEAVPQPRPFFPAPSPPASPPEVQERQRPRKSQVQVQANRPWCRTAILLEEGDRVSFTASGRVSTLPGGNYSGPSGQRYSCDTSCTFADGSYGQLIAKIGEEGRAFVVDDYTRVSIHESGILFLGVNDCCNWNDNSGSFSVLVVIDSE